MKLGTVYLHTVSKQIKSRLSHEGLECVSIFFSHCISPSKSHIVPSVADMNGTGVKCNQIQKYFLDVVRNGDCEELQKILESRDEKININLYDNEGQTALHQSCLIGSLKKVQILVKFGADIKLANRDGWNALHIASFGGHQDIALYLISTKTRTKTVSTSSDS